MYNITVPNIPLRLTWIARGGSSSWLDLDFTLLIIYYLTNEGLEFGDSTSLFIQAPMERKPWKLPYYL